MATIGRFAGAGREFWGEVRDDRVQPLVGEPADWSRATAAGTRPVPDGPALALAAVRPLAPVTPAARIVCFGGTYREHMQRLEHVLGATAEHRRKIPGAFLKPVSAIVDPGADIRYPATTAELDFEIELVVVMGGPVDPDAPGDAILGYTIGNDVSARDAKGHTGASDFFSMKALDRTCPLGPWIITRDELGLRPDLELRLEVNGEVRQRERTSSLAWGVEELVAHVDARLALAPGDLVFTGTPAGVAWEDGRFLEPGDAIEASIERIGTLRNVVGGRA